MQRFVSFIVFALLVVSVYDTKGSSTTQQQCTISSVCNALDNVWNRQDRLEKEVKEHGAILGRRCDEDGSTFSASAVVQCTSMVKSIKADHYKLDALGTNTKLLCRALSQPIDESQAFTVSAELLNKIGWKGINSGHLGLLYNVKDENNFDFVYFRPHSAGGCYQTGYMVKGKLVFVKSAACPNGPPKGGVWFPVSVSVHGEDVKVYHSGVLVTSIKSHFPPRAWGGVFTFHGYENVIFFRKFKIAPQIYISKRCNKIDELPGYTKLDANNRRWPQDGFCQVAYLKQSGTSSYQLSVDMYNFIGLDRANYGHPGVFFNAEDEDNYDFVYFRAHSISGCYQTGYVYKGQPKFDGAKTAACPTGPPKGAEWFNIKLVVSTSTPAGEVKVYLKGTLVTSFNPRYPIRKRGGVLVANGFKNVVYYKNFKLW